jgi:hypothetical protein
MSAQSSILGLADALRLTLALGDREAEGLKLLDGESEAEGDCDKLAEADDDAEGDILAEGLNDTEALALEDAEALGETDADGDRLALGDREAEGDNDADADADGDLDALGEVETDAEGESDALGLLEAEGDREGLVIETAPGAVPYQPTPGLGPGWPSSYRKILSARLSAVFGNSDWSIREITPSFQLLSVRYDGSGKFGRLVLLIASGIGLRPPGRSAMVLYRKRISPVATVILGLHLAKGVFSVLLSVIVVRITGGTKTVSQHSMHNKIRIGHFGRA